MDTRCWIYFSVIFHTKMDVSGVNETNHDSSCRVDWVLTAATYGACAVIRNCSAYPSLVTCRAVQLQSVLSNVISNG